MSNYILGIDQSTQGTKALLFDESGELLCRTDLPHKQIVNERGWVEHDPMEIIENTIQVVKNLVDKSRINKEDIIGIGISNQRETALAWDKITGNPIYHAIVWQCARGEAICNRMIEAGHATDIMHRTGLRISPYFSAAKLAWILEHVPGAKEKQDAGNLCMGTMDCFLIYQLTHGKSFKTDYSNASRTQLFNITTLRWDEEVCRLFGIQIASLPTVCDSDAEYGITDLGGFLEHGIPIHAVMGDSHGALFGQGCTECGMVKATYGTGSSVMMNIGEHPVFSDKGVVTSLAWSMGGKANYVLEGNINYTGAVISWLQNEMQLITEAREAEQLALEANPQDKTYLIPAFTGLGAPYWDSLATGTITGMSRTTGKAEIVKAALESIAYQITDIVKVMSEVSGIGIRELRVDGGPTKNHYLMQFQSDLLDIPVQVPEAEELSGIGAAYAAGIAMGIYDRETLFARMQRTAFKGQMKEEVRHIRYKGWQDAVGHVLTNPN
ncbi:MAG: glycerol kinase [Lachnospiraceae bacterium]